MKLLDVIRKEEMQEKGHCYNCVLAWEQRMYDDCDAGCIIDDDVWFIGKKECLYPNWLKRKILEKHNKAEEEYWKSLVDELKDEHKY